MAKDDDKKKKAHPARRSLKYGLSMAKKHAEAGDFKQAYETLVQGAHTTLGHL